LYLIFARTRAMPVARMRRWSPIIGLPSAGPSRSPLRRAVSPPPFDPAHEARHDRLSNYRRRAGAMILPWEIVVPRPPGRHRDHGALLAHEPEVANRNRVRGDVPTGIGKRVELFDIAKWMAGFPFDPGSQPRLRRPMADLERARTVGCARPRSSSRADACRRRRRVRRELNASRLRSRRPRPQSRCAASPSPTNSRDFGFDLTRNRRPRKRPRAFHNYPCRGQ
jgi:hypothetical protein